MQKLSDVWTEGEIARKFLQTGEKSGKVLLKPSTQKKFVYDGRNKKHQRKAQIKNDID
jgi:hypothetical protein